MQNRQFIRHPVEVPIMASRVGHGHPEQPLAAHSIGAGGLAFRCDNPLEPGTVVHLRIPCVEPAFEADAKVVWRTGKGKRAEIGVEFLNASDAYQARMVEQVCHIENYRRHIPKSEGRKLSLEQAAAEWIGRFAASFPDPGAEPAK